MHLIRLFSLDYDTSVGTQPLATAAGYGDCRNVPPPTNKSGADYIPCAHFYPEFWGEAIPETQDQKIEPSQSTGFLGFETWFMTKFTADEYPQFVSYHGLQKKEYQQLLAETFKRPTTWKDYCEQISKDNCTTPDDVAQRSPLDEEEATKMFAPDPTTSSSLLYTGHFRYTNKNNCTLWPSNCTGHIANYPCGWSSNMESNLYHLNIALDSKNGPNGEPNGYTESQLKEMWHAANATRSHLMMQWWSPEPLYQQYLGTDAEMQRVTLKPYTRECALARAEWKDECASDIETRVGSPEEACGDPVEPLRKLITKGLYETLTSPEIPIEAQSPAYDVLRFFSINEIQLGELFDAWHSARTPRDGVCKWAVENLDDVLKVMIPPTYPRVTEEEPHSAFGFVTLGVGVLATLLVVLTGWMVYRQRYVPSIRYAQVDFLSILLFGSFLVGIGSVLLSTPASDGTCLSSKWLVNLGYTLELVPLILKVGAINKMMQAARELRRITIRRDILYKSVAAISLCVLVYLAIWSAIDPPQQVAEYSMTGSTTATGEYIVGKTYYCSNGASAAWQFAAVAWNAILLMCASVLAFQTRNVLQTFNESRTLAFLIYSHFIFVLARISIIFLSGHVKGSILDYSLSLIYSLDQMAACCIYFVPKLLTTTDEDISDLVSRDTLSHGNSRRFSTGMLDTLQKMKVLENSSDLLKIENTKGAIIEELRDLDGYRRQKKASARAAEIPSSVPTVKYQCDLVRREKKISKAMTEQMMIEEMKLRTRQIRLMLEFFGKIFRKSCMNPEI